MVSVTADLYLPGTSGSYGSTPDSAALSVTGDITLLCRVALDDWTAAGAQDLISKFTTSGNQRSYSLSINTSGQPAVAISTAGGAPVTQNCDSAIPVADGATVWVLASWQNSDDRLQFFTAPGNIANPVASDFTQLGSDATLAASGIFNATSVLEIGSRNAGAGNLAAGKFYRAKVYNGVFSTAAFGGTLQFDADFTAVTPTATRTPSSFAELSSNAATVTINGSAWDWRLSSLVAMPPRVRPNLMRSRP